MIKETIKQKSFNWNQTNRIGSIEYLRIVNALKSCFSFNETKLKKRISLVLLP